MALRPISKFLLVALLAWGVPAPADASRLFDNVDANYMNAASIAAYNVGAASNLSIQLWIKRADSGALDYLLRQPAGGNAYAILLNADNTIGFATGSGQINSTATITGTDWHHLVFTSVGSSGAYVFYVDSVSVDSGTGVTSTTGQDVITLGGIGAAGLAFNGRIALVGVWTSTLTPGQVTTLYTTATPHTVGTGNIASWPLCEPNSLTDFSSNANIMLVNGTVASSPDNPAACTATTATTLKGPIGGGVGGPIISGGSGGF